MSIIYDKNFLKAIYKIAEDAKPKISKDVINKLFDNLIQGGSARLSSLSGDSGFNSVTISNIANLENYLSFLRDKKVAFSNSQVVSEGTSTPSGQSFQKYQLDASSVNINLDGLKTHVLLLFTSPSYNSKPLYREMLGRLVAQIKMVFGIDIPLPDIGDETEIIRLQADVDVDSKYVPGDKILRLKHLRQGAFDPWYKSNINSVFKGGKKIEENDGICPLLEFISKNTNNPEKYKNDIIQCARGHNCPWAGQGSLPSSSSIPTSQQAQQSSLSDKGKQAENNLRTIINSGGPFYREFINVGLDPNEIEERSLLSFINNSLNYFNALSDPRVASSGILSVIPSIRSRLLEADRLLGNKHYYTPTSKIESLEYQIGFKEQDESMRQYRSSNFKGCLDELLNQVVRVVISHIDPGNLSSKFQVQTSNELNNKEQVINNIYLYNRPRYR